MGTFSREALEIRLAELRVKEGQESAVIALGDILLRFPHLGVVDPRNPEAHPLYGLSLMNLEERGMITAEYRQHLMERRK